LEKYQDIFKKYQDIFEKHQDILKKHQDIFGKMTAHLFQPPTDGATGVMKAEPILFGLGLYTSPTVIPRSGGIALLRKIE
jgi:hypothetical protein